MKKILLYALAILLPAQASAWEGTLGVGFDHRHFDASDQIGAVSPTQRLEPSHSSGLRIGGSALWKVRDGYKIGPEVWISQGWLTAPRQSGYFTKTAGLISTGDLTLQSVTIAAKAQVLEGGGYRLFAKPGFLVTNLTAGFFDRVDADTGAVAGLELSGDVGKRNRIFVDVQAVLSPSTEGKGRIVLSTNLVLGVQWIFADEAHVAVSEPLKESQPAQHPAPADVAVPAAPTAPSSALPSEQKAEALKHDAAPAPEAHSTEQTAKSLAEPAQAKAPEVLPAQPSAGSDAQRVKGTLKLSSNGRLDPASYPIIQRVIDAHKQKPSVIKILHRKDAASLKLAKEIEKHILRNGCARDEIEVSLDAALEKPIKISVLSR